MTKWQYYTIEHGLKDHLIGRKSLVYQLIKTAGLWRQVQLH